MLMRRLKTRIGAPEHPPVCVGTSATKRPGEICHGPALDQRSKLFTGQQLVEARRLGLPAYGSDLNPVAVMIGQAMVAIRPELCSG